MNTTPPLPAAAAQRSRAFFLIATCMILVLLLLGYERWLSYGDTKREAETNTFNYAAIIEARLEATLRRVDATLLQLAHEVPDDALNPQAVSRFANGLNSTLDRGIVHFEEVSGLRVFDANGDLLYTSTSQVAPMANIAERAYFKEAQIQAKPGLIFSGLLTIRSTSRSGVIAVRSLRSPQGAFRGVIIAVIELERYEKLFQTLNIGARGAMVIRRSDDFTALVRWPALATETGRALPADNPVRAAMTAGKPAGTLEFAASSDNVLRTYSYRSVANYPFFVLSALAHEDVLANWYRQSIAVGAVAALLFALLVGLLRYLWQMAAREADAATELLAGEERLRLATKAGGIGLYDLNVQTGKAIINDEYASMLGYDPARFEESNQAWIDRLHPDDRAHTFARYSDYIVGKSGTYSVEFRQRTSTGEYRWIQSQGSLVARDGEGKPLRMLGTHVDISGQKDTESMLRELNARLDFLLSSSPVTLYTCEAAPPYAATFISKNLMSMLGYTPEEFLNTPNFWADRLHPEDRERVFAGMDELLAHGFHEHEYRFLHQDGSWRYMMDAVRVVKDHANKGIELIGYFLDITDRRAAQQDLLVKQTAMDSALNGIAMTGLDRSVTYVNQAFLRIWHLDSPDQVLGRLPREFIPDAPKLIEIMMRDGKWEGEMQGRRADGSSIDLQVAAHMVRNANGEPICMMASFVDISDKKNVEEELRNLNVQLESRIQDRTAKLEEANKELETFTYSVSHDLRAPLRGIDGYSNLLLEDYAAVLDNNGKKYLGNVRKAAQQMGTLIDDLLAYTRMERRELELASLDPREIIEALLAEFDGDIRARNAKVTVNVDCGAVRADRDALAMALRNLIGNALKFSQEAVQSTVEIGSGERPGYHQIWVRDNGIGFDMKYHNQIFTIFKRLERGEKYPGTGVGLAIVKKSMERIGGTAWAESEPGKGAVFFLEIPK